MTEKISDVIDSATRKSKDDVSFLVLEAYVVGIITGYFVWALIFI